MANITMTNVDPGEGSALAPGEYTAVYGGKTLLDMFYPVGSTYKTYDTTFDPNDTWGGVWTNTIKPSGENEIVSTFEFSGRFSAETGTLTRKTKLGTTLTFMYTSNGQVMLIVDGASGIDKVRQTYNMHIGSGITGDYGVFGLAGNTTTYNYYSGLRNGSGGNSGASYSTEGPNSNIAEYPRYYSNLCSMNNGNKTCTVGFMDIVRRKGGNTSSWFGMGQLMSGGSGNYIGFSVECAAYNANTIPAIYQRGVQNFVNVEHVFEVYETANEDDYKVWRREA